MKSQARIKRVILLFFFVSSPFLTLFLFNFSSIPFSDLDAFQKNLISNQPPSKANPILQSSVNNFINGQGNDLNYRAVANVTGFTTKLSASPSFLVTTNVWNISYTSFNVTNIKANTINSFQAGSHSSNVSTDIDELFASPFSITNSCMLNNISVFRSALANNSLTLTTGGSIAVDYGPINITIILWNATSADGYYKPHKTLKVKSFLNKIYGWAMNGSPSHIEYPEVGWETFELDNFYLLTENTNGNTFFISINTSKQEASYDGKEISSFYQWHYRDHTPIFPNLFNSTDNGTTWEQHIVSPFFPLSLWVNISLSDTIYPSNISLEIDNLAVNDTNTPNQGLWSRSYYYPYDGDNFELFSVNSNWSLLSFNVSYICSLNKSSSISAYYSANGTLNYIAWNSTINFDLPNLNLNNTIYITFPINWNATSVKPLYDSANYTQGSNKVLEIYNSSVGIIETFYKSQNLIDKLSVERYIGGIVYEKIGFNANITYILRINASFADFVTLNSGNLSVFDFNGVINFTDQQLPINNVLNFTTWDIDSTTKSNGTYLIRVFWSNGTAVGINCTNLNIIYPTSINVISPTTKIFYREPINLVIYFRNLFADNIYGETGIQNANVTAIFNNTARNYTLTEHLEPGYYNATIDTFDFENGTYDLNISVQKFGYHNWTVNLLIEIVYNTSLLVNTSFLTLYYSEAFDIELNYNRSDSYVNEGINSSTVQVLINGSVATSYVQIDTTEENIGNYTLYFNTTNCGNLLLPGFSKIVIKISKQGYDQRQAQINISILTAITTLENYSIVKRQGGLDKFNITVFYNNTILNRGIVDANLSIYKDTFSIMQVFNPSQVDNDSFYLYDFQNGTYNIELNITIGLNYTMQILILTNKTGYQDGIKTIYQEIWVWATDVSGFSFSDTVIYGQNQTINFQYNNITGGGISPANVFSTWNDIGFYNESVTDYGDGSYTITFDTNLTMAGNHTIAIRIRRNGYEWNTTSITFRIAGYKTNATTLNLSTLDVYVNDSIFNIRVRYYNISDNYNVSDGNVLFKLRNSSNYLFDTEMTSAHISDQNETNGWYNFTVDTSSLHSDLYNLTITIEFHNISIAFEYSSILFIININRLPSNLSTILHTGNWWKEQNTSLQWYEWENITIYINFKANFYDTGVPIEDNVSWGTLYYKITKVGEVLPILQGQFLNLGNGIYQTTINLSMTIQSKISEDFRINITGLARDIQNSTVEINLKVLAKKDITILFLPLPEEIVENDVLLIQMFVLDTAGRPAHAETLIVNIHILTTSGYHIFRIPLKTVGGFAAIYFQVPSNVQGIIIEGSTEKSITSWASKSHFQPIQPLPESYNVVRFLRIAWPFITAIAVASISLYYYKRKYKPKKIKRKGIRDTISYRFKSAANLVHVLIYDQKTSELLYVYSTPGIKITTYLINSILESISMYDNMKLSRQEIFLRDDARLILHDGEFVRVAMVTKELPSVEMQKQLEQFLDGFELKFGSKIPEWRKDISRLARMMDMGFANDLIEEAFEKSLTFPHNIAVSEEGVELTDLESKLFEIAKIIRSKSGPFLLQRLIARGHTELSPTPLLKIMEAVYNLRKKKALIPISAKEAQGLKDETFKKGEAGK